MRTTADAGAIAVCSSSAHTLGGGLPDADPGTWWCAQFPNPPGAKAYYTLGPPLSNPQAITDGTIVAGPPADCRCAHPDLAEFLHDNLEQGVVYIDADLINEWDGLEINGETAIHFRDHLFTQVSDECEHLADTYHGSRVGDNCQQAYQEVDLETIPLTEDNESCYAWVTYGEEENMTIDGVLEAWTDLREETTFELVVLRGMNTITLDYYVAYTL